MSQTILTVAFGVFGGTVSILYLIEKRKLQKLINQYKRMEEQFRESRILNRELISNNNELRGELKYWKSKTGKT